MAEAEPGRGPRPSRIVVVGAGFAGLRTLRRLERLLPADAAELTVVSPVDHMLYTSLLPQVCASSLEPRHLAVAIRAVLRSSTLRLGHAVAVDHRARTLTVRTADMSTRTLPWDRLVLAPGAVTRTFHIPGLAEHALGLKTLIEAVELRDHVLRQLELADATVDPVARAEHCTFVVVGAGYTGTELVAQMAAFTRRAVRACRHVRPEDVRWLLVDHAPRILHELGPALGVRAVQVLLARGVQIWPRTTVTAVTERSVTLHSEDGGDYPGTAGAGERGSGAGGVGGPAITRMPTRTVIWCAGVSPSPLIATLGLPTVRGRLAVDEFLRVPSAPGIFALGDAAAVPDVTRAGVPAGQTAQHAVRQAAVAANNVAASLGYGTFRRYRHHDLGFVVDLGGRDAVANPLGRTVSGLPAVVLTRAYHLLSLPTVENRARVATDWLLDLLVGHEITQLGSRPRRHFEIAETEQTGLFSTAGPPS